MNTNCYFDVGEFVSGLDSFDDYGPQGDVADSLDEGFYAPRERHAWETNAIAQQLKPAAYTLLERWKDIGYLYNSRDKGHAFVARGLNQMGLRGRRNALWNSYTVTRLMDRIKMLDATYN